MVILMSHHTLLQRVFDGLVESIGRTQPSNIIHKYKSYVGDTPFAYFAYATLAVYFAYRFKQAYNDRALRNKVLGRKDLTKHEQEILEIEYKYDNAATAQTPQSRNNRSSAYQEEDHEVSQGGGSRSTLSKSPDFHMRLKQHDQNTMAICVFASLAALNWSVAPIIKVPQYYAVLSCIAAEYLYSSCGSNFNNRQCCKIAAGQHGSKGDVLPTIVGKYFASIPFINNFVELVTGKMPFDTVTR